MSIKSVKFSGIFKILLVFILLSFVGGSKIYAQYYPVHATVQWPSPQSPYLSDYYSGSRDRLIVTLLNRDLQQPLLFAKLRIRIKSPGFLASNREEVNYPMLELNANVPTRLTNIDLAPYLQPQNLQTNGALRNGQLPVGYTEFSVQVVDYYTGRALSGWHTGRSYLDVKKPPILNFPEKDAQVGITDPLYIRFQWMPRNQGLAGTEYEFVLKELPDNGAAPQSAFAYGNEIYRIRTRNTTLNYTHLEPILFPNRRYAWQVQAIARDGVDEIGMFENGGFSEIGWFYLTDNCQAPTGLKAHPRFAKADLSWNKVIGGAGYVVECRPKTKLNVYEWSNTRVAGETLTLAGLKPGWTYEWRVGTICTDDRPVFSDVHEFTLSSQNDELLADCGKEPVRNDLSQEPNLTVRAGDVITIGGDYPMTITEAVSLGDGWYAGRGKTRLKTIIDAPVSLRFDRLRINVDNFQIDGTVEASYDENKAKIADLDYVDDGGKDIKPATIRVREHKTDFTLPDIPQFSYNPKTGELETTDADGNPQTIKMDVPENVSYESIFPMMVTDNKGNTYQISPAEQNTEKRTGNEDEKEHKDEKIALNCERVDRVGDFNTESLSSKYDYIHFERGEGKYAFDDGKEEWYKKSVKTDRFYKPFAKGYIAPWKLVPSGETDVVTARYDGQKNIELNKVRFVSEPNSTALPARLNETEMTWTISLRSVSPGTSYDVYALYEGEVIGKLRVVSYAKQNHKVTIVPINEVKLDKVAIEQELNTIYNPVGIQFTVDVDESMRGNYDWEVESEKDSLLSTVGKSFWGYDKELKESTEMLNLQKAYQQVAGTLDGAYLFVLNGATGLEGKKDGLLGEMPRKSRFGYIFAGNSPNTETLSHTIAHELGHGIFTLQHTFDYEYAGKKSQGKTRNLMDYDPKGKEIAAFQWNIMAKPAVLTLGDSQSDGAFNGYIVLAPDLTPFSIDGVNNLSRPQNTICPIGTLPGFTLGDESYQWDNDKGAYIRIFSNRNAEIVESGDYKQFNLIPEKISYKKPVILFFNVDKDCQSGYVKVTDAYLHKLIDILNYKTTPETYKKLLDLILILQSIEGNPQRIPCQGDADNEVQDLPPVSIDCSSESVSRITADCVNNISKITSKHSAKETNEILQKNYGSCVFNNLDINTRIQVLKNLLQDGVDDQYWEFSNEFSLGDQFFLDKLIISTPKNDRVRLLKEVFMANNYNGLLVLWKKSKGFWNNDVKIYDILSLIGELAQWVKIYYKQLDIKVTTQTISDIGIPGYQNFEYPVASITPVCLGINGDSDGYFYTKQADNGYVYRLKLNEGTSNQVNLQNGHFIFKHKFLGEVEGEYLYPQGMTLPHTYFFSTELSVSPFEPVVLLASRNYNELGIKKGESYIVPAFMAAVYQQLLADRDSWETFRSVGNYAAITVAVIALPYTYGGSWTTYTAIASGIVAAADEVLKSGRLKLGSSDDYDETYKDFYQAWDGFYSAIMVADAAVNLSPIIKGIRQIDVINSAKKLYDLSKSLSKNKGLLKDNLQIIYKNLSKGVKNVVADHVFNLSEIKLQNGVLPTGKNLNTLKFEDFVKGFDADFINSMGTTYANNLNKIMKGLDRWGDLTEDIVSEALRQQGYVVTEGIGKYGTNNGFDVVAYKGSLDNPTEILIVEAKQFKQGKILDEFDGVKQLKGYHEPSGLTLNIKNDDTELPIQMSMEWVDHVANKLRYLGGEKTRLYRFLDKNSSIVERYVFAIDKRDGSGYFVKLSNKFIK